MVTGQAVNPLRENETLDETLAGLAARIARWTEHGEVYNTAIENLALHRRDHPSEPTSRVYQPSLCLIAQGSKRVMLGEETLIYNAHSFLITAVHLPTVVEVRDATPEKPYLGLRLEIDRGEVSKLLLDSNLPEPRARRSGRGMATGTVRQPLLNAFQRLIDLLDHEQDIPILAPVIQREIIYRLLVGEQGERLRQIATAGSQSHQIARAIEWLKGNFTEPLRVDSLAEMARMSTSTFHHHFRAITALSPLQFQKHLRLQEARRLMLTERLDAAGAAFQVGYESPSQFSREYSRLFGSPPMRDLKHLRKMMAAEKV